jgi:hypothetical protein
MRSIVSGLASRWQRALLAAALPGLLTLSGCASDNSPSVKGAVRDNASCRETRRELDRLDARGVPAQIEAANAGKKLSSKQQANVDRYNRLLQVYLGSRCHL